MLERFLKTLPLLAAVALLLWWESSGYPARIQVCEITNNTEKCGSYNLAVGVVRALVAVGDRYNALITALATVLLVYITYRLVIVAREQAKTTQAQLRAFVHATALGSVYEFDTSTGHYNWRLQPQWTNSGDTPTRRLKIYSACEIRLTPLPPGFDFSTITGTVGSGLLGPKIQLLGGQAPQIPAPAITPQDLVDVQTGIKHLYVWGWARYNDTFPGTPEHITRFCWYVRVVGNPFAFVPGSQPGGAGGVAFPYVYHMEGNCADDECA